MITITAFQSAPDRGRGLARDMPVRWALEEAGQAYDVRLLSFAAMKQPSHLALQPFGQIPTFEDGELTLFESGAIVLVIAERYPGLLPTDAAARARVIAWMFAAASTIEPPVVEFGMAMLLDRNEPWFEARLPRLKSRIHERLEQLASRLGTESWLEGEFSAGDLMVIAVLRRLAASALLQSHPTIAAYVARGEARPAFQRAFAAQRAVFDAAQRAETVGK